MYDDRIDAMRRNKINNEDFIINYNQYEDIEKHKFQSNQILTNFRLERTRKEMPKTKIMTHYIIDDKMKEKARGKVGLIDVLLNDKANTDKQPNLQLLPPTDNLWVMRPIGNHVI